MSISRIGVDSPVVQMGFEEGTNIPAVPASASEVAWYEFTPAPGLTSNAVFTGHVDWQTRTGQPIPGAFYRLRELTIGDEIRISLEDGRDLRYIVTGNVATKYDDPNVVRAMQLTARDVVTLITCGGTWVNDPSKDAGGNYSHRIVVRAELVTETVSAPEAGSGLVAAQ
jgi:LPXTG-site transpeptidase (sortase) family protein